MLPSLSLLAAALVPCLPSRPSRPPPLLLPRSRVSLSSSPPDGLTGLLRQLDDVRNLLGDVQKRDVKKKQLSKSQVVSGTRSFEPSFTRLFTQDTWDSYTGKPPLERWILTTMTWRHSTVLRNVWPVCLIVSCGRPPAICPTFPTTSLDLTTACRTAVCDLWSDCCARPTDAAATNQPFPSLAAGDCHRSPPR